VLYRGGQTAPQGVVDVPSGLVAAMASPTVRGTDDLGNHRNNRLRERAVPPVESANRSACSTTLRERLQEIIADRHARRIGGSARPSSSRCSKA